MNKKYYIFITNSIYGYGGGQLLTLRKAKFLRDKGWSVLIIYKRKMGDFHLEREFGEFNVLFIPDFSSHYNFVKKKRRNEIVNTIKTHLVNMSNTSSFIESNDLACAVWGELLSKSLEVKHALYMLTEENMNRLFYYPYKRFYKYKLHNNELWGCNSRGIDISFGEKLPNYRSNYINVAFDEKEISERTEPQFIINKHKNDSIVIATLTRLEKPYLTPLIDTISLMCKNRNDINVCFIIAGGSVDKNEEEKIRNKVLEVNTSVSNLHIQLTGYIKPGKDFFDSIDIFVGMGTAAISALAQGCIVLPINPLTNKTPGIFGVETFNFAYPDNETEFDISKKIRELSLLSIEQRKVITEKSREYFINHYTLESTYEVLKCLMSKIKNEDTYSFDYSIFYKPFDYAVEIVRRIRNFINGGKEKKWVV